MYPYATTKKSLSLSWSDWHIYNWDTVHKVAPLKSGVYVLAVKMASGGWEKFYIGQAENLDKRLKDHLSDSEPNKCIKENLKYTCMFRYAVVESQSDRDKAERALYKGFKPECNDADRIPAVADVEINF